MPEILAAVEQQTSPNPEWSVIWMHGLGADGYDFASIVPALQLPDTPGIRFVFPHAPMMPITCNNGYVMRAWYDIIRFDDINRHADEAGIQDSLTAIRALIARENERGIPCERIIIAGFSQGGAMAYTVGLTHPQKLAGIIALSTYIPSLALLASQQSAANCQTPVFAAHGDFDPVVPIQLGDLAKNHVASLGNPLEWHPYPIQHGVSDAEILAIGQWIKARLGA